MKLVNVKFDEALGEKMDVIAKTEGITVTEVVRDAVTRAVDAKFRDHEFRQRAQAMLDKQRTLLVE